MNIEEAVTRGVIELCAEWNGGRPFTDAYVMSGFEGTLDQAMDALRPYIEFLEDNVSRLENGMEAMTVKQALTVVRHTTPEAREASFRSSSNHHRVILETLSEGPVKGMTAEEISDKCGLDYHKVNRRMSELEKSQQIKRSCVERQLRSGRYGAVWVLQTFAS